MTNYYIIAERNDATSPFGIAWGDYDKDVVIQERDDMLDSLQYSARNLKILTCASDSQADGDAAIAKLNAKRAIAVGDYVTTPRFDYPVQVTGNDTGTGDLIVRYVLDNGADAYKTIPAFSAQRYVEAAA